ncbi:hypothetical protein BASA81_011107 [Batrachochytrium salamandrivorans]|nr:hypothetical protein BASA81_011107 [Batrachochytrium salamandrivorans]
MANRVLLVPFVLACAGVLAVFLLFGLGTLGSQYDPARVWELEFGPTLPSSQYCEAEQPSRFIKRPLTACFSFAYVLVGFAIVTRTVADVATLPEDRNLFSLLERETFWGLVLGAGPVFVGFASFLALGSNTEYFDSLLRTSWWVTINLFAAFAWARALQYKQAEFDRAVVFSYPSLPPLMVCGLTLNVLLGVFREEIIRGDGEVALVFFLLWNLLLPVYLHWKVCQQFASIRPFRFAQSLLAGAGAWTLYLFSTAGYLCLSPQSAVQPYAAFQIFSALALWLAYQFFRSDTEPFEYRIVVQNHRDQASRDFGVHHLASAYLVPENDPYASTAGRGSNGSRRRAVPDAMVANPPQQLSRRSLQVEDSGSARRISRDESGRMMLQREGSERGGGSFHSQNSGGRRSVSETRRTSRGNSLGDIPIVMATAEVASGGRSSRALSETVLAQPEGGRPMSGSMDSFANLGSPITTAPARPVSVSRPVAVVAQTASSTAAAAARQPNRPSFHEVSANSGEFIPAARPLPPSLPERRVSAAMQPPSPVQRVSVAATGRLASNSVSEDGGEGRPSFVPGRSRRSSVDRPDNNAAVRLLERGGGVGGERTVERERALSGAALDSRTVQLRSPEEAQHRKQSLLIAAAQARNPSSTPLDNANMTTEERLDSLRRQRAQLQRDRSASGSIL